MLKKRILIVLGCCAASVHAQSYSQLWGEHGELFDPNGRLPDFSYAGYWFGDKPLPEPEVAARVTEFGAIADDELDDTQAFRDAISSVEHGAILIPPGRYLISDVLWIEKPGIVLRGSGSENTVLHMQRTLEDVRPNMGTTSEGRQTSNYSWSGGFIWVRGGYETTPREPITHERTRGSRSIEVADPSGFTVGDRVLIEQTDNESRSLMRHFYGGDPGDTRKLTGDLNPRLVARIKAIHENRIELNRPLRWDVRTEWTPTVRLFLPRVHDVGVEKLTIEFDPVPYGGHFSELGRNAIAFNGTSDCWVRDVRTLNCDSAIFFTGMQGTIDGLRVESDRQPNRNTQGHHGVTMGLDNILMNFRFDTHYIHDITMTRLSAGNVIKNGSGVNLSLDHHKRANHANLYCNLDAGDGSELWRSGGGVSLGKNAGAWTTFWAIRTDRTIRWPRTSFGPALMNLVGLNSDVETQLNDQGRWFERVDKDAFGPRDLHQAQLDRRRAAD